MVVLKIQIIENPLKIFTEAINNEPAKSLLSYCKRNVHCKTKNNTEKEENNGNNNPKRSSHFCMAKIKQTLN